MDVIPYGKECLDAMNNAVKLQSSLDLVYLPQLNLQ